MQTARGAETWMILEFHPVYHEHETWPGVGADPLQAALHQFERPVLSLCESPLPGPILSAWFRSPFSYFTLLLFVTHRHLHWARQHSRCTEVHSHISCPADGDEGWDIYAHFSGQKYRGTER